MGEQKGRRTIVWQRKLPARFQQRVTEGMREHVSQPIRHINNDLINAMRRVGVTRQTSL